MMSPKQEASAMNTELVQVKTTTETNKRPTLATSASVGSTTTTTMTPTSAQQKRASFSQQQQQHRRSNNNNNNQSFSSQASSAGGGGSLQLRRRDSKGSYQPAPALRRQASSMESNSGYIRAHHQSIRRRSSAAADNNNNQNHSATNSHDQDNEDNDNAANDDNLLPSSNADYERIRNETLLFFLDRLYLASTEGKEARTLHDLSCLFGTREFTREMRQIVGASRNGLKKFLQSFPSLFQIEEDKVYLTQLKVDTKTNVRDYNREAVDYFKQKLLQFGASLVPIRNLFGYRSQASQEVRHVSGKNARDFRRFLKANEDVFELMPDGEHVMLKSVMRELRDQNQLPSVLKIDQAAEDQQQLHSIDTTTTTTTTADSEPDDVVAMDPYLNKRFAHLIEQCLQRMKEQFEKEQGQRGKYLDDGREEEEEEEEEDKVEKAQFKVTLDELNDKIKSDCSNELFLKMVKTHEDMRVFLRMHPKYFRRFSENGVDFVSLVSEEERRQMELRINTPSIAMNSIPYQPTNHTLNRQHSALEPMNRQQQLNQAQSKLKPIEVVEASKDKQDKGETTRKDPTMMEPPPSTSEINKSEIKQQQQQDKTSIIHENSTKSQKSPDLDAKSSEEQPKSGQKQVETNKNQQTQNQKLSTSQQQQQQQQQAQLRANAPPFIPNNAINRQVPRSLSNLGPRRGNHQQQAQQHQPYQHNNYQNLHSHHNHHHNYQQQSFDHHMMMAANSHLNPRQRPMQTPLDQRNAIRNYLTRPSASGSQTNNSNVHWAASSNSSKLHQSNQPYSLPPQHSTMPTNSLNNNNNTKHIVNHNNPQQQQLSPEDLRARTVDIVREASNIITRIMHTTDAVAFDCKGYNLGFDGQITLIQFGFLPTKSDDLVAKTINNLSLSNATTTTNNNDNNGDNNDSNADKENVQGNKTRVKPEVCVFDLITNPELAYCLKPLLESDKIVKIVHDVRNKSNALYVQFKIILNNVFDTQVANLVIQQQDTGKPAYKSRYISMSKLCEVYGDEELLKYRNLIKSKTRHSLGASASSNSNNSRIKDVNFWRNRPLTKPMIIESTMDVYCLIGGIYQNLKSKLKPEYEPLFEQLNLEGILARIKPDEIRSAKKGRKIDLEVIDLKRKLYRNSSGPVVLSNREIRLLRHVDLSPEVRQKIQQCKKVAKKLERLDMKAQQQEQLLATGQMGQSGGDSAHGKDLNDHQSLQSSSLSSTGEASMAMSTSTNDGSSTSEQQLVEDEERILSSFMDSSSMFDELKDKMIESSNLLDSIEDSLRDPL